MSSSFQRELFRLPRRPPEPLSSEQLRLLDWLTFGDGRLPLRFHRGVLRALLRKRWVEWIREADGSRYRVTAYGAAARQRGRRHVAQPQAEEEASNG